MILNTHTPAKVLTSEYQHTLEQAVINRNRVSEAELEWLNVPPSVGTGAYDNEARGWLDNPDHNGAMHHYTPLDGPMHKGDRP